MLETYELDSVRRIAPELQRTFDNVQIFRTETEMRVSILNDVKHPTADSKFWQAVREQNVMMKELVMLSYDYRAGQTQIKILKRNLEQQEDALESQLMQIEIDRLEFLARDQERTAKDRIREIELWSKIKSELEPEMKHSKTDVNEHQLDSYCQRWTKQAEIMGDAGAVDDRVNLLAQLDAAKREIRERGNHGAAICADSD